MREQGKRRGAAAANTVMPLRLAHVKGGALDSERKGWLTSDWLISHIQEHGGVMTVAHDLVVD